MSANPQSDKERVIAVYAKAKCVEVSIGGGRMGIVIPRPETWRLMQISNSMNSEAEAWADAASRLPSAPVEAPALTWTCEWCGKVNYSADDYAAHKDLCDEAMVLVEEHWEKPHAAPAPPVEVVAEAPDVELPDPDIEDGDFERGKASYDRGDIGYSELIGCRERQLKAALLKINALERELAQRGEK